MIELNLLPEELKKKRRRIELPELPLIPLTVGIVIFLAAIQLLISGLIFLNQRQLKILDKKWEDIAPRKKELDRMKKIIAQTGRKNQAIEELMKRRINWARLLNNLSNDLTPNIWLRELSYEKDALALSGTAAGKGEETTAHIARFITILKSDKDFFKNFTDIELISIKKGFIADQDVMNFILLCKFKPVKIAE